MAHLSDEACQAEVGRYLAWIGLAFAYVLALVGLLWRIAGTCLDTAFVAVGFWFFFVFSSMDVICMSG